MKNYECTIKKNEYSRELFFELGSNSVLMFMVIHIRRQCGITCISLMKRKNEGDCFDGKYLEILHINLCY